MKIKLEYLYSEGSWRYNRVLVDGEQAGFVAINRKLARVGRTTHHPNCYPNLMVLDAIAKKLSAKGKFYTF